MMQFLKKHKGVLLTILAELLVCGGIMWYEARFYEWNLATFLRLLSDGMFVAGIFTAGIGALAWVAHAGALDAFSYLISSLRWTFSPRKNALDSRKHYFEYRMEKQKKRVENGKPPVYILVAGVVFLGLAILLAAAYAAVAGS
jgi:hypothetical protein